MHKHHGPARAGWERVGDRHNALNFIRFVLAALVLVDHSFPLAGQGEKTHIAGLGLGTWCVAGFFCLSGYLIAGSRTRTSAQSYLWRRCLRIFPGLLAALLLTAFVLAPVAALTPGAGPWQPNDAARYVARNMLLYNPPFAIGETLRTVPYADAWNGSLWTLFFEFCAYLAVGLLLSPRLVRRHAAATFGALTLFLTVMGPTLQAHAATNLVKHSLFLGSFFVAGSFMWSIKGRVPLTHSVGTGAIVALVLAAWLQPQGATWAALPLAYVLLWLGSALPIRTFSENDISYGVYVYAFPIQQLITVLTGNRNLWLLMAGALAVTVPIAALSWRFVEKPALRLKRLVS